MTKSHAAGDKVDDGKKKSLLSRLWPVVVIGAALALFFAMGWQQYFSIDALRENREQLLAWRDQNFWQALLVFSGVYVAAVAISFPGSSILTIFGGFLFGLWAGTGAVIISATLGAMIIYFVAKNFAGGFLQNKASGFIKKMEQGFRDDELSYMFLLRLVPAFPFWAVNIAAGLLGVKPRNYFIGTLFGIIPASFVFVSIGDGIGAAFDAGDNVPLSGILTQPAILLPIIGLVFLAVLPIIIKRFFGKKPSA
jgi:uncharacterized membrane protein YdjX (TVP38/TMEM64 family)